MRSELWCQRFEEYLLLKNRRPRTIETYSQELKRFLFFLVDRGLQSPVEVSRQELEAYQVHLHYRQKRNGDRISLKNQHRILCAVKAFFKFLHESQLLLYNPARDLKLPKVPKSLPPKLLSEEQVLHLLAQPDTTNPIGLRDRAVLELLYSSALRNQELRLLNLGDVDLQGLEVRILEGKGGKSRVVPLGEPAAAWMEEYLLKSRGFLARPSDGERFFVSQREGQWSRNSLARMVRTYAEKAGLPRVTPHLLRHCCATHMLARQAGLRHLQALLGHASPDTTQLYTKVEISDLREVHRRCHPRESF